MANSEKNVFGGEGADVDLLGWVGKKGMLESGNIIINNNNNCLKSNIQ